MYKVPLFTLLFYLHTISLCFIHKAQGATLQNYNNELVKCIEDLREKREEVNRAILKEEEVYI